MTGLPTGSESHEASEKVRVTSFDLGANGKVPQPLAFSHPSHFCPQIDTWLKKRRERLMPITEVCSLVALNQTCHMQSSHHSVGDRVKTVEKTVAIPTSNFQVIVGAEISLTSSVFILENLQSTL